MGYSIEPKYRVYVNDAIKTVSKKAIQKTAKATGDLIGNTIADKKTKALSQNSLNRAKAENTELNKEIPKERYKSPEKRPETIDEVKLIYIKNGIPKNNKVSTLSTLSQPSKVRAENWV